MMCKKNISRHIPRFLRLKSHAFFHSRSGVAAVEFALIGAFLSIILLNIADIGIFMFRKMEITGAVRAGSQYALVAQDSATSALITGVVQDSTNLTGVTVAVDDTQCGCSDGSALFTCTSGTCSGATTGRVQYYTQINASYTHTWIFYPGTIDITASSTIRTQ